MSGRRWFLLSPEYPPALGGVSDYVRLLARELAGQGERVGVWAPEPALPLDADVAVHGLPAGFDRAACVRLRRDIVAAPSAIVLLEYVPMGIAPLAVERIRRLPGELWVMFHEVAYPLEPGQTAKHRALALGTHALALALARRASQVLVSTPACETTLNALRALGRSPVWLPIPSNVPADAATGSRREVLLRAGLDPDCPTVGHFSAYGPLVAAMLRPALASMLEVHTTVQILLAGNGSEAFAASLAGLPGAAGRVRAFGRVGVSEAANVLVASDVLVYPYPDGVTTRRTSVMAALALGRAVVTTHGANSEDLWWRDGCVDLVPNDPRALAERSLALLDDERRREALGRRASTVYARRFAMPLVAERLRQLAAGERGT